MNRYRFLVLVPLVLVLMGIHPLGKQADAAAGRGRAVPLEELPEELRALQPRDEFIPSDQPAAGTLERVTGSVVVVHSQSRESYFAAAGDPIFEDDVIHTLQASRCRLKFTSQDLVSLGEETQIHIQDYLDAPEQKEKGSLFNMLKGKAMFYVIRLFQYQAVNTEVSTQTAIVGVRGTKFGVEVRPVASGLARAVPVYLADASGSGARYLAAADPARVETVVHGFSGQVEVTSPVDGSRQTVGENQSLVLTPQGAGSVQPMDPGVMAQFLAETEVPTGDEGLSEDEGEGGSETGDETEPGDETESEDEAESEESVSDEGEDAEGDTDAGSGEADASGEGTATAEEGTSGETDGGAGETSTPLALASPDTQTPPPPAPPDSLDPIDPDTDPISAPTTEPTPSEPISSFTRALGHIAGIAYGSGRQEAFANLHLQDFSAGSLLEAGGRRLPGPDKLQVRFDNAGTGAYLEYARIYGASGSLGTTHRLSHTSLGGNAYMEWGTWTVEPFTLYQDGAAHTYNTLGGYYLLGEATPPFDPSLYGNIAGRKGAYTGLAWGTYWDGTRQTPMSGTVNCNLFWGIDGGFKDFNLKVWENESGQSGKHAFILGGMGIIDDGVLRITDNARWELYNGSRYFNPDYRLATGSLYGPDADYLGGSFAMQMDPRSGYADSATGIFQAGREAAENVPALPRPDATMAHLAAVVTDNGYPSAGYFDAFVGREMMDPNTSATLRATGLRNPSTDKLVVQDTVVASDDAPYLASATINGKSGTFGTTHPVIPVEIGPYGYMDSYDANGFMEWGCWYTVRPFAVLDGTTPVEYELQKGYYLMGEATVMSDLGSMSGIGSYAGPAYGTYWDRTGGVDLTGFMECEIFFNPVEVNIEDFVLYVWDETLAAGTGKYVFIEVPYETTLTGNSFNLSGLGSWEFFDGTRLHTPTHTRLTGTLYGPGAEFVGGAWGLLGVDGSGGPVSVAGIYQGERVSFATDMGFIAAIVTDDPFYPSYIDAFASQGPQNFNLPDGVFSHSLKNWATDSLAITADVAVDEAPYLGSATIQGSAGSYGTTKPLTVTDKTPTNVSDPYYDHGDYMEWGTWSVANPLAVASGAGTTDYSVLEGYYLYGEQTSADAMANLAAANMTGTYSGRAIGTYAHYDGLYATMIPLAGNMDCSVNFGTGSVTSFNLQAWQNEASQTGAHAFIQNGAGEINGPSFVLDPAVGTWEMFNGSANVPVEARSCTGSFYGPAADYVGGNWGLRGSGAQNATDSAVGIFHGGTAQ